MTRRLGVFIALLVTAVCAAQQPPQTVDLLFTNVRLLDGTGNPWRMADVGLRGDRIAFVGDAHRANVVAQQTLDLSGQYLAPGFIDLHTHSAGILTEQKENLPYLMQGVTTVMNGNDGGSPWPIAQALENWERQGIGTNAALFVGFGTIRRQVLQMSARAPNADELAREQALARQGMREGAFGLSTGLFYSPQSYSKTDEVIAVAKAAADLGGIYDSHLRDEDSYNIGVRAAVSELIEISRQAHMPGMVSHIKCLGREAWGCAKDVIELVRKAREQGLAISANQYPYTASGTALEAAVFPNWAAEDGRQQMNARIDDPSTRQRLLREIPALIAKRGGPDTLVLVAFRPEAGAAPTPGVDAASLRGKSLDQIAKEWKVAPEEAVLRIVRAGGTSVVSHNMNETDLAEFMKQDWVATGSDGSGGHPRLYGTFAQRLEKYVVADKVTTLPFAIRAMTSLPAQIAGFTDRGLITPGYFADIVVFDLAKVHTPATYLDPTQLGQGFTYVLVNGKFAVRDGQPTHTLAGHALRGPAYGKEITASTRSGQ
jgi:N-acyl-D-aspartate/D-glutamate deacylase